MSSIPYRPPAEGKAFNKGYFTALVVERFAEDQRAKDPTFSDDTLAFQNAQNISGAIIAYHCECICSTNLRYEKETRTWLINAIVQYASKWSRGEHEFSPQLLASVVRSTREILEEKGVPYSTEWARDLRKYYREREMFLIEAGQSVTISKESGEGVPVVEGEVMN